LGWFLGGLGLCALLLAGCAYHLGPTTGEAAGDKSISIAPFVNETLEPRLGDVTTQSVRKLVQRDGTYRLDTHGPGDIAVTGTIIRYERNGVSYQPSDVLTVMDYRLTVTAHVKAVERASGRVVAERDVTGYALMRVSNDLTGSERQALPLVADDLGRRITTLLVDGTW
jgi:hypothetical protein